MRTTSRVLACCVLALVPSACGEDEDSLRKPEVLARAVQQSYNARTADTGFKIDKTECIASDDKRRTFVCVAQWSNGENVSYDVTVNEDGTRWVSKDAE